MPDLTGQSLGRYHLLEKLGEGGMATVYKAYDTRLKCEVALKIIRTERITPESAPTTLKRFENEAQKTARLTHPNIVPVIDYGDHEGTPYLVMKYIPGGTLKQFTGKPMHYQEAIRLILPVADALEYAHSNGIIHRDVKPANILITESGIPMLSDFGVAKILDIQEDTMDHLTMTGVGIGTPEYMSPEQAAGKKVDGRSDIYSLGIILYELITGRKPFIADTPLAVIIKQTTDPLPRPRQYIPNLPEKVERVLFKALAKKPEDRFVTIREFKNWLQVVDTIGGEELPSQIVEDQNASAKKPIWMWILLPVVVALGVSVFLLFKQNLIKTPEVHLPDTAHTQVFALLNTREPTDLPTPTEAPTPPLVPTPDQSVMFKNPYAGPVPEGAIFRLGKGTIVDADISADGMAFLVATNLGLYVYDVDTLELEDYFPTTVEVGLVEFSPVGSTFVTSDVDGSVSFWELEKRNTGKVVSITRKGISDFEFTNDGKMLIIGAYDQTIRFIDTNTMEILRTIQIDSKSPVSINVHPAENFFAALFDNGTIEIIEIDTGEVLINFNAPEYYRHSDYKYSRIRYQDEGQQLSLQNGYNLDLISTNTYKSFQSSIRIIDSSYSKDFSTRVRLETFGKLFITEIKTNNNHMIQLPYGPSMSNDATWIKFLYTPDSKKLFLIQTYSVSMIDISNQYQQIDIADFSIFDTLFFLNKSNKLVTRSIFNVYETNTPEIWSGYYEPVLKMEDPISGVDVNSGEVPKIFVQSRDGSLLVGTLSETESNAIDYLYLWDAESGEFIKRLPSVKGGITKMVFSNNGNKLVAGSQSGLIQIYDIQKGIIEKEFSAHKAPIYEIAFTPDGLSLISSDALNNLKIWETSNYSLVRTFSRPSIVSCASFSEDGSFLITGETDGTIVVWDTTTWTITKSISDHTGSISDLEISHNGKLFASISEDSTIRIWDIATFELLKKIDLPEKAKTISFSGDDQYLASFGYDITGYPMEHISHSAIIWPVSDPYKIPQDN